MIAASRNMAFKTSRTALPLLLAAQTPVSVWILFGVTDADQVRRDGTIQVRGGRITRSSQGALKERLRLQPRRESSRAACLIVNLSVPGFSAELDLTTAQTPATR